jgi:transcriptional regulator GlxA family with amidase domain
MLELNPPNSVKNRHPDMDKASSSITTVVLGSPWAGTSTTYSILDVLSSVGRDWAMLHGGVPHRPPIFAASLLTLDGRPYRDANGRRVTPDGALADCPSPHLIIVPDLHLDPSASLPDEFTPLADWIANTYERGALAASVCSGTVLLAATGLLNGIDATTHWGYADMVSRYFPQVRIRRERILIPAGDGHRLITAGGASAWADLMLYLIGRLAGVEEARRIAKLYLLETHTDGQLCYASLAARRQHDDQLIADAQVWAAQHYDEPNPVGTMAVRSGLSERTFLRRFRRATGQSPVEYIQTVRMEEAKQMLEATCQPIDEIAAEIGYSEPSSFRSAFRKRVGLSASAYRKKWRGIGTR